MDIIDSLSPIERKILPYLNLSVDEIIEKTGLDNTAVLHTLKFLENKGFLNLKIDRKTIVELGVNGIRYIKNSLPERTFLTLLETKNHIQLEDAKSLSKLSENEFRASLGALKKKALITLTNGKISLTAKKEELTKKFPEEKLLEILPVEKEKLSPEELFAFDNLKTRKEIIEISEKKLINFELTEKGKKIAGLEIKSDLLEEVTPELIKNYDKTKSKKFRKYDLNALVPQIQGGKKHFVNQSIEYAKKIWIELGFEEMTGPLIQTSFWNFDALFTPQDHPVREMQDTFFIKKVKSSLPKNRKLVEKIKRAHETGLSGSKGWQYTWSEQEALKPVLRTHTTCLSAQTLANLDVKKQVPGKFFSIGKCLRNETVDWSHGFEFNQTEGIVIDPNANFRHLLGYLKEFFEKMGFSDIKFTPAYFPYTEPSVEILAFHPEKKIWLELGGAGIFRPEVVIPLLGEYLPVLAWGPGFDRILMDYYKIQDLRELYKNDLSQLRKIKAWIK